MNAGVLHEGVACSGDDAALSRALQYGDGVFRTALWIDGEVCDWALHLQKLAADCAALDLLVPAADVLADDVRRVTDGRARATVKIVVARRGEERGYRPTTPASERWVYAMASPSAEPQRYARGVDVAFSDVRLSEQPLLAGIKHLNRLEQVLASRRWPQGIDELLMRSADGAVVGGTRTNLFCVIDNELVTPALDRCGVAGIMRQRILELAGVLGLRVSVTVVRDADLARADEVFVTNALIGIWPVRNIGGRSRLAPGPLTRTLTQALRHPLCTA